MRKNRIDRLAKLEEGSNERKNLFQDILADGNHAELACAFMAENLLSYEEKKEIAKKTGMSDKFTDWMEAADVIIRQTPKVQAIESETRYCCSSMQCICDLIDRYEMEVELCNQIIKKSVSPYDITNLIGSFGLNNGVETFRDIPIASFTVGKQDVRVDCSNAFKALNVFKEDAYLCMSAIKAYENYISAFESKANKLGFSIPKAITENIRKSILVVSSELCGLEKYSFKVYQNLLQNGETEKANAMKDRFIFPDYSEVKRHEDTYSHFSSYLDNL